MSSVFAPFCGPNTVAAPVGPSRGAVTSLSRRTPPAGRRTQAGAIDAGESGEFAAAVADRAADVIEQTQAKRRQRPGPAVGRRRTPEADDQRGTSGVQGRRDHLAEPAGGRAERIE